MWPCVCKGAVLHTKKKKKKRPTGDPTPWPCLRGSSPAHSSASSAPRYCGVSMPLRPFSEKSFRVLRPAPKNHRGTPTGRSREILAHSAARPDPEPGSAEGARALLAAGFFLLPDLCPETHFVFSNPNALSFPFLKKRSRKQELPHCTLILSPLLGPHLHPPLLGSREQRAGRQVLALMSSGRSLFKPSLFSPRLWPRTGERKLRAESQMMPRVLVLLNRRP